MPPRNTIQKTLILEAVRNLQCHATAQEIYSFIVQSHPTISKGTVYRNLNLLSENGDILKVENLDGIERYDHNCHNHYHIQCVRCNCVFDAEMDYMDSISALITGPPGVKILSHNVTFRGLCPSCNTDN